MTGWQVFIPDRLDYSRILAIPHAKSGLAWWSGIRKHALVYNRPFLSACRAENPDLSLVPRNYETGAAD